MASIDSLSPLTRLGIRYLNRIDVRLDGEPVLDLDLYLNFRPHIPKIGKGPISGYMLQATLPTDNDLWSASITSTIVSPPPLINHVSLLLDIDIFRTQPYLAMKPSSGASLKKRGQ